VGAVRRNHDYFFLPFLPFLSFFDFFATVHLLDSSGRGSGRSRGNAEALRRNGFALQISDVQPSGQQTQDELRVAKPTLWLP
jgi:hypothetical protein